MPIETSKRYASDHLLTLPKFLPVCSTVTWHDLTLPPRL